MKPHSSSPQADRLAEVLASADVAGMAAGLASDPQVHSLWNEHPAAELYSAIVEDPARPAPVRFAAALVLRSMSAEQFGKTEPAAIAQAFGAGLQQDLAGYAFPWGWLWDGGDELGILGRNFLALGTAAIPALEALLDDPTLRNTYLGSDEASLMAVRRYRVKDFAAFYLAHITGIELPWEADLARRDAAIATLHERLTRVFTSL